MSSVPEVWQADSDHIFTALTSGGLTTFEEAERAVVMLYIPDMSFSRAGISHALKRLEQHFQTEESK